MISARPSTGRELWNALIEIFPEFSIDHAENELSEAEEEGCATLHSVMLSFTQYFGGALAAVSDKQVAALADLLNNAVLKDDSLENAISTCFLEHLRQIGGYKKLAPFLSRQAKDKTHA